MNATRIDIISKLFATRRSRRQALAQAGAGLAAGALAAAGLDRPVHAQEATPPAAAGPGHKIAFLFLQAFRGGRVAPKEGAEGRYTLTLEQGLGQTIYFSDRPDRVVGATPTPQFLDGLGFPDDNPPNAALVVETDDGQTELAILELFAPAYDESTRTATYEVAVLAEWERAGEGGITETAPDLSAFGESFGAAHLFIDDCADAPIACRVGEGSTWVGEFARQGYCYNFPVCVPCDPYYHSEPRINATWDYWNGVCNSTFSACNGNCKATPG